MSSGPRGIAPVAVLGSTGAVGRAVCRALAGRRDVQVRAGARRASPRACDPADPAVETVPVDVDDPAALARFCAGARLVVNCSGPAARTSEPVAAAADAAGADVVDAGGDDAVAARLAAAGLPGGGRATVLSAGMAPGLSGLLIRWVVAQVDRPAHLTCYLGGLDRFTAAGAADYLLGLGADPGAGAAWGRGRLRRSSVPSRHEVELPLFPGRVSVHPYVGAETARLADALGLAGAEGYAVFPGDAVRVVLGRFAGQQSHDPGALDETVAALCHAAEVDLAGRSPFHMMSAQVDGGPAGAPATRTAVLHGADAASVTGAVAVLAADAVLDGRVPPGVVHRAAEVLAPDLVVEAMRAHPSVLTLDVVDGPVGVADPAEEGEL